MYLCFGIKGRTRAKGNLSADKCCHSVLREDEYIPSRV